MPALGLLTSSADRSYGGLPTLPLTNMWLEQAPTEPGGFNLRARPRLGGNASPTVSSVHTRAIHAKQGFGTVLIYGTDIYVNAADQGNMVNANSIVSTAANEIGVVICEVDEDLQWWDGSSIQSFSLPSSNTGLKVLEQQGRFIFLANATNRYYWTEPLSDMLSGGNITVNALNFATAESSSDRLVDGIIYNDFLVLGGLQTIEFHSITGNTDAPWQRVLGSTIELGVYTTNCMALWKQGIAWLSNTGAVYYTTGSGYQRVSDDGIEELLADFSRPAVDSFIYEGHEFLRIRPQETNGTPAMDDVPSLLLDSETMKWHKWETDGGKCLAGPATITDAIQLEPEFGEISNGRTLKFSTANKIESIPEKRFRAGVPIDGGNLTVNNVLVRCQTYSSGTGTLSMRYSRDKGTSWSSYVAVNLYDSGIRNKVEWRSVGMFDHPGALFEFKTANQEEFGVSGAYFNEYVQGRSR